MRHFFRLENVEANMQAAMEFSPESFAQVAMLYIDCIVNGYPVKAFIDSGNTMTVVNFYYMQSIMQY